MIRLRTFLPEPRVISVRPQKKNQLNKDNNLLKNKFYSNTNLMVTRGEIVGGREELGG